MQGLLLVVCFPLVDGNCEHTEIEFASFCCSQFSLSVSFCNFKVLQNFRPSVPFFPSLSTLFLILITSSGKSLALSSYTCSLPSQSSEGSRRMERRSHQLLVPTHPSSHSHLSERERGPFQYCILSVSLSFRAFLSCHPPMERRSRAGRDSRRG